METTVTKIKLEDGGEYTGHAVFDGKRYIPNGCGVAEYPDRKIRGIYKNGEINGLVLKSFGNFCNNMEMVSSVKVNEVKDRATAPTGEIKDAAQILAEMRASRHRVQREGQDGNSHLCCPSESHSLGYISNGNRQGWGLNLSNISQFGVFESNKLKVDLSPLVNDILKTIEVFTGHNRHIFITSYDENPEVFIGVDERPYYGGRLGFHFFKNGEVYVGSTEEGEGRNITGLFYHFDCDFNIHLGRYLNGRFIETIDKLTFLNDSRILLQGSSQYFKFSINMNYAINNFDLDKNTAYWIFAIADHPDNIIIMANPCEIDWRYGEKTVVRPQLNITENTRFFMFPSTIQIMSEIENIIMPWVPKMDDFHVAFINCCLGNQNHPHLTVYKHENPHRIVNLWDRSKIDLLDNNKI